MAKKNQPKTQEHRVVDNKPASVAIVSRKMHVVAFEVQGTADLIQNKFSQKAIEEMLKKHMGISVQREKKSPRDVLTGALVKNTADAICIPPTAFKLAMITASADLKTFKKTNLRRAIFMEGGSIPISFTEMVPRMDIVRVGGRQPDVRFRPSFLGWSARMVIQYAETISAESIADLLDRAGSVGVGEWRPDKNGLHGTFCVSRCIVDPKELKEVRSLCAPPIERPRIPEWALDAKIDTEMLTKLFGAEETAAATATTEEVQPAPTKKNGVHRPEA